MRLATSGIGARFSMLAHRGAVSGLAFASSGRRLYSVCLKRRTGGRPELAVWVRTGQGSWRLHRAYDLSAYRHDEIAGLSLSPDDRCLALGTNNGGIVQVWAAE